MKVCTTGLSRRHRTSLSRLSCSVVSAVLRIPRFGISPAWPQRLSERTCEEDFKRQSVSIIHHNTPSNTRHQAPAFVDVFLDILDHAQHRLQGYLLGHVHGSVPKNTELERPAHAPILPGAVLRRRHAAVSILHTFPFLRQDVLHGALRCQRHICSPLSHGGDAAAQTRGWQRGRKVGKGAVALLGSWQRGGQRRQDSIQAIRSYVLCV